MNDEIGLDDEETKATLVSDTLYIALTNKSIKQIPLAFTVPDNVEPITVTGFTIAWTKSALRELSEIQKATSDGGSIIKNIPYVSLRGLLEVGLNDVARIKSDLGLSRFDLSGRNGKEPNPFIYLNGNNLEDIHKTLRIILNEWITGFIKPFAEKENVPSEVIGRLEDLLDTGELLTIHPLQSQVIPWKWSEETGTTQGKTHDFQALVDYVARAISGKEIFQGLGTMKRVISSSGSFTTGIAELITNPITLPEHQDKFSLVIRLEVVTYPSLHQPLLKIDVSKRRWFSSLKAARFNSGNLSGFVFSNNYQDRAFSYKVLCEQEKQGENKIWRWTIDKDFEALRRKLKLPIKTPDGQNIDGEQIALGKASTDSCQVMLTYRNGLQEGKHEINVGVPEIDKLEAFEAIATIVEIIGFQPFENYSPVKFKRGESHKLDDTASRMINLPTLLGTALENLEKGKVSSFTSKFLESFDDAQLNSLLNKHFNLNLDNIQGGKKSLQFTSKVLCQVKELKALIQANQQAVRRLYLNEKLLLVVFYEEQFQTELKLLKTIIHLLWGGAFELIANRLPAKTHGPRELLEGANLKAKARSRHRIEAWEPIVKQLALRNQRTFCLVMARDFYPNNRPDDRVNKPSTRQALAQLAGSCVQFLLPIETTKEKQLLKLDNFFHRVQAALKDLLSAHCGRIDNVKEKVDKYLKDIPAEARPKEIIGITIVRKQKGRARGFIDNTFLPIAMRLKIETGECELCCAYEKGDSLQISRWSKFSDAIAFISKISPVKLADKKEVRQTRFMEFVKQIISNSVEEGNQPLVMIDSSNCVQLWPWLADARMNANEINLSQQYERMQDEWQGARLVRIRQDLAPGIIEKKVRELAETSLKDTRTKKELTTTHTIDSASPVNGLFQLTINNQKGETNSTGCVAYLSVRNNKPGKKRGQSCYRRIDINTPVKKTDGFKVKVYNKAGLELHNLGTYLPCTGQWPTPNPLEIVVTLRQPEDNPDCLAALVESLRYGFGHYSDWSSLPAPLFFERVVRDYISEFAIEDEEMETGQGDLEE